MSVTKVSEKGTCSFYPFQTRTAVSHPLLTYFINEVSQLQYLQLLNLGGFEEEHAIDNFKEPKVINDSNVTLKKHHQRKAGKSLEPK